MFAASEGFIKDLPVEFIHSSMIENKNKNNIIDILVRDWYFLKSSNGRINKRMWMGLGTNWLQRCRW